MSDFILVNVQGPVMHIVLNRPNQRNCFSYEVCAALIRSSLQQRCTKK